MGRRDRTLSLRALLLGSGDARVGDASKRPVAGRDPEGGRLGAISSSGTLKEGKNADYIPALAKVDPELFGIALVTPDGKVYTAGDVKTEVSIQSISKVFTMAQVIQEQGPAAIENRIGVDATGARFNSIIAVEGVRQVSGTGAPEMNPLVNPGAISTTSMVTGATADAVWAKILGMHNDAAGRQLTRPAGRLQVRVGLEPAQPGHRRADARLRLHQERTGSRPSTSTPVSAPSG